MKIQHVKVFNVPRDYLFDIFTDADELIDRLPSKVSLRNPQQLSRFEKGSLWHAKVQRAGRVFKINNVVTKHIAPTTLSIESESNRLKIATDIQFDAIDDTKTGVVFNLTLSPKGLLGRVLLQTIRSSSKRVNSSFESGMDRVAKYVEDQYAQDSVL